MPTVLVPIANGSEEMEAVITIDILRRAQWSVTVAGVDDGVLTAARGVRLVPDARWAELCDARLRLTTRRITALLAGEAERSVAADHTHALPQKLVA